MGYTEIIMQKIGIVGVHGSGKTSLAYILSAYFKMKGVNAKLIHESVRENCPFPINADANQGTCLWNFHKQFLNELEAEAQGYDLAICDRSVLDTFVYFHAVNPKNEITTSAELQASQWLTTYDLIIVLEPSAEQAEIQGDGIRETNRDYQKLIADGFRTALRTYGGAILDKIAFRSSDDVFKPSQREELIRLVEDCLSVATVE